MARVRAIGHEDRLTLVEHLDELRSRLIVSAAALLVAVALCFWQNHLILDLLNTPLPGNREPVTFGVSEPFMTTLTVSAYAGILLALPVILYQGYSFFLPAFSPDQRRVALPLMLMVPVLFVAGVVFSYAVVLPAALKFLVNFNSDQFNIQIRAREYYGFVVMTLGAMGLLFQIPVGVLAATKLGLTTPRKMRQGTAARDRGNRGDRDAASGHGPRDDVDHDGADGGALRAQHHLGGGRRQADEAGRASD